ncbi:helicase-associated domain-containing protein [Paenibacillus sp. P96]|uniref:DNA 3'-5' helicase n=1 Tax=Paenibacillus zeirhizosphaerae TaxID=2987519 RepID=A0ABT9FQ34_9BACL|nr:DNA repair helicase XPB [Paenibacillus sp. P96]MDP4096839.1 helicase-associated domain-containing protein [Paenibacillus sp. P96]
MKDDKPCMVQRDGSVLLATGSAEAEQARSELQHFAELIKSPTAFHTYRITPLSLWHAASLGWTPERIIEALQRFSKWDIPAAVANDIRRLTSRYGKLRLEQNAGEGLKLVSDDEELLRELLSLEGIGKYGLKAINKHSVYVPAIGRGLLKQELTRLGYPIIDSAGFHQGSGLSFTLTGCKGPLQLRDYQADAVKVFEGNDGMGGSGVLVLPCGAGKTVIGMAVMERLQCEVLILTSNTTSVRQWIEELKNKTDIPESCIGEYSGQKKQVRPVTAATYQILTHRRSKEGEFEHMKLLSERNWGLIVYDEVHLLPAPVFRATADIQATRRLGLTATLVREDGAEQDVFSLIGPKRYEMPWKVLEQQGWIAKVECVEMRIPMAGPLKEKYNLAEGKQRYRLAAENPAKLEAVRSLLGRHEGKPALVIGQYLDQLRHVARELNAPLITGSMPQSDRVRLFEAFRRGEISTIIVSKVANFAVDLPDAAVAVEISGSFGSRQEEAQRLGRILRPKQGENRAFFYTLVTENSKETEFAAKRQMFLIEQGYEYRLIEPERMLELAETEKPVKREA